MDKQAQAGEPEVVAFIEHHKAGDNLAWDCPGGKYSELITMQAHREAMEAQRQNFWQVLELREQAIYKKDAALQACVEALESYSKSDYIKKHHPKRRAVGQTAIATDYEAMK